MTIGRQIVDINESIRLMQTGMVYVVQAETRLKSVIEDPGFTQLQELLTLMEGKQVVTMPVRSATTAIAVAEEVMARCAYF